MRPALRILPRLRPFRVLPARTYATLNPHTPPPTSPYQVFDEPSKDLQRSRAIIRLRELQAQSENGSAEEEDGLRVDLKIPPSSILELSSHAGQLTQVLQEVLADEVPTGTEQTGVEGRRKWWIVDSSPVGEALWRDDDSYFITPPTRIQASASDFLKHPEVGPLKEQVEAVVSAGGLHWVGDIVGGLTQVRHLLKPDGVFVAAVFGGDTIFELRTSLQLAEQERRGGIANRVSPMISSTDAPSLLNRAGFTSITVDVEDITVNYPSMWELIADLRDMGESNAILGRRTAVGRDVLIAASSIYQEMYGNEDGSIPATFSIIFLIGWKPGPNQPQPSKRGSGETNLKDVL
ncbi:hypothetical protein I314_04816 [Cryptococcus bacillisporus CA1873]|uniref:Methyltransferase type 11 domain-containing protein n=2 Tax=Cryptococcus gattii TaxID=552467 RepID=A0A0D0UAL5_CRYGA|nr:hypothetical protein I312_05337 [Cryptococcus bacillisporus CA1280]KIR59301.1 hypothetical protein I314_04816 [Cryptococcus bacillisporus CA1873]|eukprot:KIR59301.1 hypothetical protein I314_04816 [Cryptococcus gattii CA1873]